VKHTGGIDWTEIALQQLATLGLELGSTRWRSVASMLAVDLIDEIWLTVCPLILGGTPPVEDEILSTLSAFGFRQAILEVFCTIVGNDWKIRLGKAFPKGNQSAV